MYLHIGEIANILFVGSGGTGGYIIPSVMRMINSAPERKVKRTTVYIADDDIVEEKNISRQNFIFSDIGKYKAEVMSTRYGNLFNVRSKYITERIDKSKLESIFPVTSSYYNLVNIIIDSVDNNASRLEIDTFLKKYKYRQGSNFYWISSGNSDKDGQVVISKFDKYRQSKTVVDLWPDAFTKEQLKLDAEREEAANCAINAEVNPQSIAINEMAATIVRNLMYSMIYDTRLDHTVFLFDRKNDIIKLKEGEGLAIKTTEQDISDLNNLLGS